MYRSFYYLLWVAFISVFFGALISHVMAFQITPLATLCFPVLAIFFGFTALLYNRARALPNVAEQRRSLYAAERAMQATILVLYAIATALIVVFIFWSTGTRPVPLDQSSISIGKMLAFMPSMLLMFLAFACFFFALRAVSARLFRRILVRELARRVR